VWAAAVWGTKKCTSVKVDSPQRTRPAIRSAEKWLLNGLMPRHAWTRPARAVLHRAVCADQVDRLGGHGLGGHGGLRLDEERGVSVYGPALRRADVPALRSGRTQARGRRSAGW
jgi:hypothetical protein